MSALHRKADDLPGWSISWVAAAIKEAASSIWSKIWGSFCWSFCKNVAVAFEIKLKEKFYFSQEYITNLYKTNKIKEKGFIPLLYLYLIKLSFWVID